MKENSCGFSKYFWLSVRIAIFHKVIHTVFSLKNLKGTIWQWFGRLKNVSLPKDSGNYEAVSQRKVII